MHTNSASIKSYISDAFDKKNQLVREKLLSDLERFFKEYSVKETGSGLLISSKI